MSMLEDDQNVPDSTALLHRPSLWKTVQQANHDLVMRNETELLEQPATLHGPLNAEKAHELTLLLQRNFRWENDEQLVEATWPQRDDNWNHIAAQHPKLFTR